MSLPKREQPPLQPFAPVSIRQADLHRLTNSVPVYTIDAGTEDVMRIEFVFRAGIEKEEIPLLATTSNMMLTEGSQSHTSEEINRLLDYYGVFLSLVADKDSAGLIAYFLSRHLDKALDLIMEILFEPSFPEKELTNLMKKRLSWYMINRQRIQNLAIDNFFESIFGAGHPYGYQVKEQDFSRLFPSMLKDFHSKYYRPQEMAIIISGRISENTTALIEEKFGSLRSGYIYIEESPFVLKAGENKKIRIEKQGTVQSSVRIGSSSINKRHPDYPGLKILNVILGGYFGSRLMRNIREEKGFTYGISSILTSLNLSGYKVISTEVAKEKTAEATAEIYKEIRLLQDRFVERAELEVVRNYMSGEMVRMFDGPFALAESFKAVWEFGLDNSYYFNLAQKIKSISPDEIMRLAKTYYSIDELYEVVSG